MLSADVSTWRVLAVDDRPDNLKLISMLLHSWNVTAEATDNPQHVMELVQTFKPNLILLDLAMPGMSGWEIHRQIREIHELDDVPVIGVTALARQEDIAKGKEVGLDGYIIKPYRVDDLRQQLNTCINAFVERRNNS